MSNELLATIGRVRRAMPRNGDVMALCDALEAGLRNDRAPVKAGGFDKVAYQREYMRRWRARV